MDTNSNQVAISFIALFLYCLAV